MDKSIEQRAEEMADERYVLHVFKDRHVINRERAAFIEGYKASQQNLEGERYYEVNFDGHVKAKIKVTQNTLEVEDAMNGYGNGISLGGIIIDPLDTEPTENLEVSERLYTKEEMEKAMLFSFDTFTVAFSRLEIERRIERYLESLPKANTVINK